MGTKILVVDDETGICDLLKIYFEKEGYEVKTANVMEQRELIILKCTSRILSCLTLCFRKKTAGRFAAKSVRFPPSRLS